MDKVTTQDTNRKPYLTSNGTMFGDLDDL